MKLFNETAYPVGHRVAMSAHAQHFLTVAVKGTFSLVENGPCAALAKKLQAPLSKPTDFLDDHGNSPRTPSDTAPFRVRADCLFIGSAHAPGGDAVEALDVAFGIGAMRKSLSVFGDRHWVRDADGSAHLTHPEAFVEMPVRAEYAHGGFKSKYNMHGIGLAPLGKEAGATVPAANIMAHGANAVRWDRDEPHAGFGMLSHKMLPRRAFLGTFDETWITRRRPLPPKDFDLAFFNAAPEDQQVAGYLVGDEEIVLENLHHESPRFRSALPGTRVRIFVNRRLNPDNPKELEFAEVHTVLDTCIVDVPAGTVTLVWRGNLGIKEPSDSALVHMLVVEEPVGSPLPVGDYAARLADRLFDKRAAAAQQKDDERKAKIAAIHAEGLSRAVSMLKEGGAPADLIAEVEKQETVADVQKLLAGRIEQIAAKLPKRAPA